MRRASKRLIHAIIALVASVILCIGACLAWFAMNSEVSGNGLQTQVKSGDIVSFEVQAYYLDFNGSNTQNYIKAETGNVDALDKVFDNNAENKGTLGKLDTFEDSKNDEMRPYDSSKTYASAVLFEVSYVLNEDTDIDKKFRIYVTCPTAIDDYMSENVFNVLSAGNNTYKSSVSNAVSIFSATSENNVYTTSGTGTTFIENDKTKSFKKVLANNISISGGTSKILYYVMDYDSTLFDTLSTKMLELGGTLNSELLLYGDVIFGIEEYTDSTPTVTEVTFISTTSKTSQAVGSDTISSTWEFLLTYSDDTYKTVKYNAEVFSITWLDTSGPGNGTATVTHKATSLSCTVDYTITNGTM